MSRIPRPVRALLAAGLLVVASVPVVASSASAITTPVAISVRLGLGSDNRHFGIDNIVPGPGAELDMDDEIANDPGFVGAIGVDIDPEAQTITLFPMDGSGFYDDISVTVDTTELEDVALLQNEIMSESAGETTFDYGVTDGLLSVTWVSTSSVTISENPADTTVFSYGADPTASLTPTTAEAGTPVVVSGTDCPNSPVEILVEDDGGEAVGDPAEVTGDADGNWEYDIDTTGLEPGTYEVATRCILADGLGFSYDVLSFEITAAGTPTPTQTPTAPPAAPVGARPTFTG